MGLAGSVRKIGKGERGEMSEKEEAKAKLREIHGDIAEILLILRGVNKEDLEP